MDLSAIFGEGARVVISPDKMRAWVNLPPPKGGKYTAEAITQWLPQNGVQHGANAEMIRQAAASGKYDELLEVARGTPPIQASGGDYTLRVAKKPFTGLKATGDGSLIYDDLSFLTEVKGGAVLADIVPPVVGQPGKTVTGEAVPAREGAPGRSLQGSGFALSEDGRQALAPSFSHVAVLNDQLVVTPLTKVKSLSAADGERSFTGNVIIEGDVTGGAKFSATGSVFVVGRAVACSIKAGNNVLLCTGMRGGAEFGNIDAAGNVWGLFFEACNIKAGGSVCANHIENCDVVARGRASILGGRASIAHSTLYAEEGVVTGTIGSSNGSEVVVAAGMEQAFIDRVNTVQKRIDKLGIDIQALQQNLTAHERVNRMKHDKGKTDSQYKEMLQRREQSLSVMNILNTERVRLKRSMDAYSAVNIIAREVALPGAAIVIDTQRMDIRTPMRRTKFRRTGENIEALAVGGR